MNELTLFYEGSGVDAGSFCIQISTNTTLTHVFQIHRERERTLFLRMRAYRVFITNKERMALRDSERDRE